jgi:hypothetical protein
MENRGGRIDRGEARSSELTKAHAHRRNLVLKRHAVQHVGGHRPRGAKTALLDPAGTARRNSDFMNARMVLKPHLVSDTPGCRRLRSPPCSQARATTPRRSGARRAEGVCARTGRWLDDGAAHRTGGGFRRRSPRRRSAGDRRARSPLLQQARYRQAAHIFSFHSRFEVGNQMGVRPEHLAIEARELRDPRRIAVGGPDPIQRGRSVPGGDRRVSECEPRCVKSRVVGLELVEGLTLRLYQDAAQCVWLDERIDRIAGHAIESAEPEVAHIRVRRAIVGQHHAERQSELPRPDCAAAREACRGTPCR